MSDVNVLRAVFLEWVEERARENPGRSVDADDFMKIHEIELDLMFQIVWSCRDQDWVKDASGMGNPSVFITFDGIAAVQAQRARRTNPAQRLPALRRRLLSYIYRAQHEGISCPEIAQFVLSEESMWEGGQFEVDEIDRAAEYLASRGLIQGVVLDRYRGPVNAEVTADGADCMERFNGDIGEYLGVRDRFGSTVITNNIGSVQSTGALSIGSTGVTQPVTVGVDVAGVREFVRVLLEGLGRLSLDGASETEIRGALEELQIEAAKETPEPSRISKAMTSFAGYVAKAGQPVLTAVFLLLAQKLGMLPAPE
jgi:hypothetical protein